MVQEFISSSTRRGNSSMPALNPPTMLANDKIDGAVRSPTWKRKIRCGCAMRS
jgi:hypothetical protein